MSSSEKPASVYWAVLTPRFFFSCLMGAAATCWFPLAQLTVSVDGVERGTRLIPMYEIYFGLLRQPLSATAWYYIGMHLGVIFFVSYWVWVAVLRTQRTLSEPAIVTVAAPAVEQEVTVEPAQKDDPASGDDPASVDEAASTEAPKEDA